MASPPPPEYELDENSIPVEQLQQKYNSLKGSDCDDEPPRSFSMEGHEGHVQDLQGDCGVSENSPPTKRQKLECFKNVPPPYGSEVEPIISIPTTHVFHPVPPPTFQNVPPPYAQIDCLVKRENSPPQKRRMSVTDMFGGDDDKEDVMEGRPPMFVQQKETVKIEANDSTEDGFLTPAIREKIDHSVACVSQSGPKLEQLAIKNNKTNPLFNVSKPNKSSVSELARHTPVAADFYANDGGFLERFKKLQEDYENKKSEEASQQSKKEELSEPAEVIKDSEDSIVQSINQPTNQPAEVIKVLLGQVQEVHAEVMDSQNYGLPPSNASMPPPPVELPTNNEASNVVTKNNSWIDELLKNGKYVHPSPNDNQKIKYRREFIHEVKYFLDQITWNEEHLIEFVEDYINKLLTEFINPLKVIPLLKHICFRAHENELIELSLNHHLKEAREITVFIRHFYKLLPDWKDEEFRFIEELYLPWAHNIYVGRRAGIVLMNEHEEFLLVQEKNSEMYSFPKGLIELYDANPLQTAVRELREELCLSLENEFNYVIVTGQKFAGFCVKCQKLEVDQKMKANRHEVKGPQ